MRSARSAGVVLLVAMLLALSYITASAEPTVRVRKDIPRDQEPTAAGAYVFDVRIRLSVQTEGVSEAHVVDNFSTACANITVISVPTGDVALQATTNPDFPCRMRWFIGEIAAGANLVLHLQVAKTVPAGDSCLNRALQAGFIDMAGNRSSVNGNNICFTDVP